MTSELSTSLDLTTLDELLQAIEGPIALIDEQDRLLIANPDAADWIRSSNLGHPALTRGSTVSIEKLPANGHLHPIHLAGRTLRLLQRVAHRTEQIDPASGLPTALAAHATLVKLLEARQLLGQRLALIQLSCELINRVGASLGRYGSVAVERELGMQIRASLQRGDYACQLGPGSYLIFALSCENLEQACRLATRWIEKLSKPIVVEGRELTVSLSAGLAVAPEHGDSPQELLDHAAAAAHAAKVEGRRGLQLYSASLARALTEDLEMEHALSFAIERNELHLVFQPKVRAVEDDVQIVGAEALVRWTHPTLGNVPPNRFIPIAERSGLMRSLGEWIANAACAQQALWRDAGLQTVPIAINVSGEQFRLTEFRLQVESWLIKHRLTPADIDLEITESALLQDVDASIRLLNALREMGINIAIDDFGTGYSSLAYLRRFPCDLLKIDKNFVFGIENDSQGTGILRAILAMANTMNMDVIVEGVEHHSQFRYLQALGCQQFQGYLFSRPIGAAAFAEEWLLARRHPVTA